ncbi:MAG: PhnD/SsuA/transferrin family substrate-binding protein [Pseudomonadota bacterium]
MTEILQIGGERPDAGGRSRARVIGVPEHFNLPWLKMADSGAITWRAVREGTGLMLEQLAAGQADIALLLTDGAVAGIANGAPIRIIGCYVESPLLWGVHVAASSALHTAEDLAGNRFAISRYGSGSHLMASIYAEDRRWSESADQFVVVNTLDGARSALARGDAEIFLWEKATTEPFVANGEFRRIDEIPTPWPAFCACIPATADADAQRIANQLLHQALTTAHQLKNATGSIDEICRIFSLSRESVIDWLAATRWSATGTIDIDMLLATATRLHGAGVIQQMPARQVLKPD